MSVRFTRSTRGRFKDSRESSREKSYAGIKVTSRSPIKNQRKRSVDSDYGMKSESPEPPKKSPKATDSQHASSSELPESQRKSPKGRFSARRQPQENQDDHSVPVKEPVVMDYSSETNQVSPDGNQSEDTDGLSVSPQNPADEDMDSESEVEVERLQESTRVSTLQTFSGPFPSTGNMQRVPDRQTPVYSHQAQADRHQTTSQIKYQTYSDVQYGAPSPRWRPAADLPATSHRENQNYSDVRCGAKSTRLTPVADTYQPTNYRKPQYYKDSAQAARFIRPTAKDGSRLSPNKRVTDDVDGSPVRRDHIPKDEVDFGQADAKTSDSEGDVGAGGDSPVSSRTRSQASSDQILLRAQPSLTRRPLRSTKVLPHSKSAPRKREGDRRPAEKDTTDASKKKMAVIMVLVVMVCLTTFLLVRSKSPPMTMEEATTLTVFLNQFDQVQALFNGQQSVLWRRSKITLRNHINLTQHMKPAILMFAAAWDGQQTMRCLANRIAGAYTSALNATSTVKIDASDRSRQNSDAVKLEVDTLLSSAFDKGSRAAVVHHFQDLPPPSTLIFYKYCDHENAAYKDVALLITVLLDEEQLPADVSLGALEVKVRDFLKQKFAASQGKEGMDTDKLSGLWSRIAHVVLPVVPVREIEERGCKEDRQ
ncbi:torsin-1A-interacting protein 2-like isoform X3 [Stegostoma tigrinum]|uniref:torsin-1A-interacting protein 2-like isoform X3 n=1 Tax=Stegostoma tigrinum TaxID=3053191 RepID=UPI00287030A4|nr:torsin-1A-interacting protein 2-like isoform X3 [Stegostoma tigrinum]